VALPRILDLFCCQGGAAMGYHMAGFDVCGVDLFDQPNYPFPLMVAEWDQVSFKGFDAVHASPPCQGYSVTRHMSESTEPLLIPEVRERLEGSGLPYIIENVRDAVWDMRSPVMLCGAPFGLKTYRHRYFESNFDITPPAHPQHVVPTAKMGRPIPEGWFGSYVGHFAGVQAAREDLGVPWMNRDGITECVPPAYTRLIGQQLLEIL